MNSFVVLALLLAIPAGGVASYILKASIGARINLPKLIGFGVGVAIITSCAILSATAFNIHMKTTDVEILSGFVTDKKREHGSYQRPYDCHCSKNSSGQNVCQTCYEDRYTVNWTVYSTLKEFTIQSLDSGSKSVYFTPDPERYKRVVIGEPVAAESSYKNYLLGLPEEYNQNTNLGATPEMLAKIPGYPKVYDFYNINRVYAIGGVVHSASIPKFNKLVAEKLRSIGPSKEVNLIVVFTPDNPMFQYAIREKWNGGKKNDVIVVFGVSENEIKNATVITWAQNEYFRIKLQDELVEYGKIDNGLFDVAFNAISKGYKRPEMKEYAHYEIYIQPDTWVILLNFGLVVIIPGVIVLIALRNRRAFMKGY